MIHWTVIEKSKEGILQILDVIKNYEKDGDVRFIAGVQRRNFSESKVQQLICIVRERLNMTRRELLRLSEIALTYNKLWATDDNNCFRDADKLFRKIRSTLKGTKIIYKRFTPICRKNVPDRDYRASVFVHSTLAYAECGRDIHMGRVMWVANQAMGKPFFKTEHTALANQLMVKTPHMTADELLKADIPEPIPSSLPTARQ